MRRSGKLRSVIALGLTMTFLSPAVGQKTGTRIDRNAKAASSISDTGHKSAILVANGFGQCLARREGRRMRAVLDLPLLATEQRNGLNRSMETYDGCLGDSSEFEELRSSSLLVIGGAAEYFVGAELKKVDLSSLKGMTDELLIETDFRPRTSLEDLSLCVVRRDVSKAQALLASKPTSDAEKRAITAIV